MILLDTHIFVWLNQNDPRLTDNHRQFIARERKHGLGISTISLIEIARLVTAKRIILPLPIKELMGYATRGKWQSYLFILVWLLMAIPAFILAIILSLPKNKLEALKGDRIVYFNI